MTKILQNDLETALLRGFKEAIHSLAYPKEGVFSKYRIKGEEMTNKAKKADCEKAIDIGFSSMSPVRKHFIINNGGSRWMGTDPLYKPVTRL